MSLDASYHNERDSICFGVGSLEILGILYIIPPLPTLARYISCCARSTLM